MRNRIMGLLLAIGFVLIALYPISCVGYTKQYKWEPTQREREEIIERAAEKMAETEKRPKRRLSIKERIAREEDNNNN